MQTLTLGDVATAVGGRILGRPRVLSVCGVSIDSRTLQPGSIYFALKGPNHDGHRFIQQALDKGATAAVADDPSAIEPAHQDRGRLILVPDTLTALGKLAAWYRNSFAAQVIATVGSNGKTTTKNLISAVLSSKMPGRAAPASYNNAVGVPLTLLSVEPADEFVVVEIGTNHPGEIAALSRIVRPDAVVITSIGEEHLEFLGGVEAVAKEEFSVLSWLRGRAFTVLSEQAATLAPPDVLRNRTVLTYGLSEGADLRAGEIQASTSHQRFLVNERFPYRLQHLGVHNVMNALAAIAIGTRFRLTHDQIAEALSRAETPPMRLERIKTGKITIINDAYNANPASMRAAFEVVDEILDKGRRVFLLGDMLELGRASESCHHDVGCAAGRSSAQVIIAVGRYARALIDGATTTAGLSKRLYAFPTIEALIEKLHKLILPGDVVLLKASRGVGLERLTVLLGRAAGRRIAC